MQGQSNSGGGKGDTLGIKAALERERERGRAGLRLLLFATVLTNVQADLEHSQLCFKALEWA